MKKASATLTFAVVILLALLVCRPVFADAPPDNVQGDWTIYSTSIANGQTVVKHVQIAQYGNRITGYFEGPDQSGPIQGRVNVHHIVFSTVTRNVLTFRGQIYGDQMSGDYGLHGKHAPWQAVRPRNGHHGSPSNDGNCLCVSASLEPVASAATYTPQPAAQPAVSYSSAPQPTAQPASYTTQSSSAPAPAPLTAAQLDALVAPIALYPDALVAQVLAAATNPDQVSDADEWLSQNTNLTGASLAQAVDQQDWDPSVKALTQFPSILNNLAHNLSWTSSLGQAFANQQSDVMAAVQTMRAKAQAAGTLQSNSQVIVTQPAPSTIVIQPANPQVVYVPQYNPTVVYGAPVVVPLYIPPPVPVATVGLYFGSGITIGASFGGGGWGGGFGWGWHSWGVNWGCCGGGGSTTIIYNHNTYINNRTWNNNNYNGYHPWAGGAAGSQNHAWYGANGTFHPDGNYKPGVDTHYGPNGGYHPNGYYGPDGGFHPDVPGTGPANNPNGGNNGNHGLIGGNGGVEHAGAGNNGGAVGSQNHAWYGNNGTFHPDGNYKPGEDTHYGPNGGYHSGGYFGPDGGFHPDKGTGPSNLPNGGNNGNHGLIGGNGAIQNHNAGQNGPGVAPNGGYSNNGLVRQPQHRKRGRERGSLQHRRPTEPLAFQRRWRCQPCRKQSGTCQHGGAPRPAADGQNACACPAPRLRRRRTPSLKGLHRSAYLTSKQII